MNVDRDEIRHNLTQWAINPSLITPAMDLCKPLLDAIDDGFPFIHEEDRETIRNVIRVGTNTTEVTMRGLCLNRPSVPSTTRIVMPEHRAEIFAEAIEEAASTGNRLKILGSCDLTTFSPPLPLIIRSVFMNNVMARLEKSYPHDSDTTMHIAELSSASVQSALSQYFKLTVLGLEKVVRMHIKPVILLLPSAIPLARSAEDPTRWVVLTP